MIQKFYFSSQVKNKNHLEVLKNGSNLDGDLGVEIEPNCLNNPTNPLLPDETSCGQMYKELLLHSLKNINSIQGLGKSPLTSDPFKSSDGKCVEKVVRH